MVLQNGKYASEEVFPINMGEEAAFERIFRLYHAPLRYFCERLTGANEPCEDIVSQLFLTLWNKPALKVPNMHRLIFTALLKMPA